MATFVIPTETAPVVPGPPQGQWTFADWEALPDDGNRYEVIDGALYMTTAPHSFHQWVVRRLERYIGIPAEDQQLAFAFSAPIGLLMLGCDPVQPDYVVVLASRRKLFQGGRIIGVPDLIVEVLSASNAAYDLDVKLRAYAHAGVPEYVVVDPRTRTLAYHRLESPGHYLPARAYTEHDRVAFDCLPTISFIVGDLFTGAPDTLP